jgi:transcriptional regulator with XRE-family HTH domain
MSSLGARFVGQALLDARLSAKMSRAQLAEALGTDVVVVRQWEKGIASPSPQNLPRVAAAVGLQAGDLYRSEGEGPTLADLRVLAGLSQSELAARIGSNTSAISKAERGKLRLNHLQLPGYAEALGVSAMDIARAVDQTNRRYAVPARTKPNWGPSDFRAGMESPHLNITEDGPGDLLARVTSPQFPRLDMRLRAEGFSMAEVVVINEHMGADVLHRFNHGQRREKGSRREDATYLIRWQLDMHDGLKRYAEIPNILFQIPRWRQDPSTAPRHPLPSGEYLLIVVDAQDPLWWISNQLAAGETATLIPNYPCGGPCVVTAVGKSAEGELSILSWEKQLSLADLGLHVESTHRELTEAVQAQHPNPVLEVSGETLPNEQVERFDSLYGQQLANPRP